MSRKKLDAQKTLGTLITQDIQKHTELWNELNKGAESRICVWCMVKPSRKKHLKYCSPTCRAEYQSLESMIVIHSLLKKLASVTIKLKNTEIQRDELQKELSYLQKLIKEKI